MARMHPQITQIAQIPPPPEPPSEGEGLGGGLFRFVRPGASVVHGTSRIAPDEVYAAGSREATKSREEVPTRTLGALFAAPTRSNVRFSDIEALIVALGGEVREAAGSRVVFELKGRHLYLHRPHPGRGAKRCQVEEGCELLRSLEIQP